MSTSQIEHWSRTYRSQLWTLAAVNALVALQVLVAVFYGLVFGTSLLSLRIFLLPFVWTTVSAVTLWYTEPVSRDWKPTIFAGAVAVGYLSLFLWLSGTIGFTPSQLAPVTGPLGFGFDAGRSFGWGPILYYSGEWIGARIIPYQLIGYLSLSYMVYLAVLDVTRSASAGTIGLVLCPGCAAAAFVPAFGGIAGVSAALSVFLQFSYEIATVMFVVAMGWLYYQPSLQTLRRQSTRHLPELAAGLTVAVASLHLFHPTHGLVRLLEYARYLVAPDPRPFAFSFSGIALLTGVSIAATGRYRRLLSALGIVLTLTFLVGYAGWHTVLDHGTFWPTVEATGHTETAPLASIGAHLFNDGYALLSKLLELALLLTLVGCYRRFD